MPSLSGLNGLTAHHMAASLRDTLIGKLNPLEIGIVGTCSSKQHKKMNESNKNIHLQAETGVVVTNLDRFTGNHRDRVSGLAYGTR